MLSYDVVDQPRVYPPTSQFIESDNAYILDDGSNLYLYIGNMVDRERTMEWFSSVDATKAVPFVVREESSDGVTLKTFITKLLSESLYQMRMSITRFHLSDFIFGLLLQLSGSSIRREGAQKS